MMKRHSFHFFVCLALGALVALGACSKQPVEPPVDGQQHLLDLLNAEDKLYRDQQLASQAMGRKMKYTVWLPCGYDSSKEYPFLYLLHGYGDDNNSWADKGGAQQIAKDYVSKGGTPMVIVMPDGLVNFYSGAWEDYFHQELIPEVERAYHCNGKRAVAGLSMGGMETMEVVFRNPDMFRYAWVLSSSLQPGTDPAAEAERLNLAAKVEKINKNYKAFVFTQGGPSDIAYQNCINTRDALRKLGLKFDYMENAQAGHSWTTWRADLMTFAPTLFR